MATRRSKTWWLGVTLTGFAALQLVFSAGVKLVLPEGAPAHFAQLGWPLPMLPWLACLELLGTVLYLVPRTATLGAVFLTAYLGGAVATHVRIGDGGVFLYPALLGVAVWVSLGLRNPQRLFATLP